MGAAPDRVALVTGAARGVGAATVDRLVAEGYRVLAVDACLGTDHGLPGVRHPLATPEDLDRLTRYGDRVLPIQVDVRHAEALTAAVRTAMDRWGRLDVAIAAAAVISGGRPVWETPAEDLDTLWDVDLVGVWNVAVAVVPHLLAAPDPGGCRFVAIASAAGLTGLFHLGAYVVVKHAVVGLVRALAADLVGTGVRAIAIAPNSTDTALLAATADLYGIDDTARLAPEGGRLLSPTELAATIAHCCTTGSAVANGAVLTCSG